MEKNGFAMSSIYTYNSVVMRRESRLGPFPPSYPSHANPNSQSEVYSKPKKITSPITGKCYSHDGLGHGDDEDEDDYKKHEAYPMKGGYEWHNRPKSPVPGSPGKVPNETNRPQRSSPLAATDMRYSAQPKPYSSGYNGYGDYGGSDKEGRKPIVSTNSNNRSYDAPIAYGDHDDEDEKYDGADNGYGSYGNNNNKQGKLPTSPTRTGEYDDYGGANRGYGGYGDNINKEGYKNKPTWNGGYDGADRGYGDNNSKEWYQPTISPIRMGKYDGANQGSDGYGNYNKEGYMPSSSPVRNVIISSPSQKEKNGGYDGANKDHGGFENYNNKEAYNPTSSPARNGNYGSMLRPDKNYGGTMDPNKPKIGTSWTSLPRKGGQLSQPTNDIQKIMELMKGAALNDEDENYSRNHDGVDRSAPRNSNWAASLGNDPRHGEPRGRFDNGVSVGSPKSQSSVSKPGMVSNKNDYGESIEKKDATSWNNGKISLSQRPQTPITHVIDGREANYRTRATGPIINSNAVEKIGGTRI